MLKDFQGSVPSPRSWTHKSKGRKFILNKYETIIIIDPNVDTETVDKVTSELQNIITGDGSGGIVTKLENWGKRKLAYDVKRNKEGIYILFDYETDPKVIQRLERYCILSESIIKHMTVRAEDIPEPRTKEITKPVYDEDDEDFVRVDFGEDEEDIDYDYDEDEDEDNEGEEDDDDDNDEDEDN